MNNFMSSIGLVCLLLGVANAQIISKDGIVKDTVTGLEWQDDSDAVNKIVDWEEAKSYCADLHLGGYSDWRLPNIYELATLLDNTKDSEPYIIDGFKNFKDADSCWSSSIFNKDSSLIIYFDYGYDGGKGNRYYSNVRCVRNNSIDVNNFIILSNHKKLKISLDIVKKLTMEVDTLAFNQAKSSNTLNSYKSYLQKFPNGEYTSSARSNIQYLEEENSFRALLQSKSPQQMYLEAGKQERNGSKSKATKLYEAIVDRFPASDFAVKASDKLTGASRAENEESNRRSQSRQECENNKKACIAGCGGFISGANDHNSNMWQCKNKCEQISCY